MNRFFVSTCDRECVFRECLHVGEDKGTFVQGRGYTSYHKTPELVCMTRHLHGCPMEKSKPDPENARCCYRPAYFRKGKAPANWQECSTCGAVSPKWVAKILNALPEMPGMKCDHSMVSPSFLKGYWECNSYDSGCRGVWDHKPKARESHQHDTDWLIEEAKKLMKANGG